VVFGTLIFCEVAKEIKERKWFWQKDEINKKEIVFLEFDFTDEVNPDSFDGHVYTFGFFSNIDVF